MEPWFYGCLSWLIPGAGQFYARRISKGLLFLLLSIGASVAKDYMLGTTRFLGLLPAAVFFIFGILVLIVATWDAVHFARKQKALPKETPDPWFPVFLSMILGLFGYVYMRKWFFVFLWMILAALSVLSMSIIHGKLSAIIIILVFCVCVIAHVYFISNKKYGQIGSKAAILFFILLISGASWSVISRYLELDHKYGVWFVEFVGPCMQPTLDYNERCIINSFVYTKDAPQVGDIVEIETSRVTRVPDALKSAGTIQTPNFIKRIVAGGGDIIEVNDGKIIVNGKIRKYYSYIPSHSNNGTTRRKNLLAQNGPYRVPEGKFFVMGDNIDNSFDSRYFGAVPRDAIIGKVVKVYWPLSRARILK